MAKRVNGNGNGNGKGEISFRILKNSEIPSIVRPKRESRYLPLIKALLENPDVPIEFWKGSTSGLKNAINRELPPEVAVKIAVVERKLNGRTHKYAIYDTKGDVKRRKTVKPD